MGRTKSIFGRKLPPGPPMATCLFHPAFETLKGKVDHAPPERRRGMVTVTVTVTELHSSTICSQRSHAVL